MSSAPPELLPRCLRPWGAPCLLLHLHTSQQPAFCSLSAAGMLCWQASEGITPSFSLLVVVYRRCLLSGKQKGMDSGQFRNKQEQDGFTRHTSQGTPYGTSEETWTAFAYQRSSVKVNAMQRGSPKPAEKSPAPKERELCGQSSGIKRRCLTWGCPLACRPRFKSQRNWHF